MAAIGFGYPGPSLEKSLPSFIEVIEDIMTKHVPPRGAYRGDVRLRRQLIAEVAALRYDPEYLMGPAQPREGLKTLSSNCLMRRLLGVGTCLQATRKAWRLWGFPPAVTMCFIRLQAFAESPPAFVKEALESIVPDADLAALVPTLNVDMTPEEFIGVLQQAPPARFGSVEATDAAASSPLSLVRATA